MIRWPLALLSLGALVLGVKKMSVTRGIRNNNPGNIREAKGGGIEWQGERATDDDPAFEEFNTPEDGIRALARVLKTYYYKRGIQSITGMIYRWAPPEDNNNTLAYIKSVGYRVGVATGIPLTPQQFEDVLPDLVQAIIYHENGQQPYDIALINAGVSRA